jgi:signal transduction histidine kinase/ligand-binding sensor domain-containing protein
MPRVFPSDFHMLPIGVLRKLPIKMVVLWLLGALLACCVSLRALGQYRFDHWTTDNGLPQNTIRNLVQTRDGYLWFTTFDGLVRFDGVRFTVFDKNNSPGIINNRFMNIVEDKDGALYAVTEDGGLTVCRQGVFTSYAPITDLPGIRASDLRLDANGEVIIIMDDRTAVYLRDGKFMPVPPEYQSNMQRDFYPGRSGRFQVITPQGIQSHQAGQVTHYPFAFESLSVNFHVKLYEDDTGSLWVGSPSGLYQIRDRLITRYTEKDGLPPRAYLRPYSEDQEGGIWFITGSVRALDNGLARYKDGRFTFFGAEAGLPSTDIGDVLVDREGMLWIGTANGLYRARKQLITAYSTNQGLAGKEVYPLLETRAGDILIGATMGLSRFRAGHLTALPLASEFAFSQALWEDARGRLWVGHIGGMHWFENGQLKEPYPGRLETVCAVRPDRQGNIWVASDSQGLFKVKDDQIVAHYTTANGLPSNDVKFIHQSTDGTLWIGTYGGLVRLKDNKFTVWTVKDGLASDRVRYIYEDADGVFWIGTYDGGLSRFRNGRFFNFTINNGLANNGVFCILEDRRNNFWISSNRGIHRVNRRELNDFAEGKRAQFNCITYGKQDGMLNTECNGGRQPAGIIARDGKMWFPTMDGVVVIDPEAVNDNPLPPPVEIETVALDRDNVAFGNGVQIQPSQTSLEISYTALSLVKSELLRFRYKLEGLGDDWIEAGTRRTAYFSYLPPGAYTFRVIAANADGVWNNAGKTLRIVVIPPFYRRWWFIALVSAATVGLLFSLYRYRVSQLERARAAQEAFTRQVLESQEAERKRIATELHDSLGQNLLIVKNWALVGLNTFGADNPAREVLGEISETSSLAIEEVRQIAHNLRPYQLERFGLTKTLGYMLDQIESASDIRFTTEVDDLDGLFSPDSEINFYRVVQECLNNVIRHSDARHCQFSIKRTASGVELRCQDDGCGFDPVVVAASPKSGLGLTGLAERVRMLSGTLTLQSAPGAGTELLIKIDTTKT